MNKKILIALIGIVAVLGISYLVVSFSPSSIENKNISQVQSDNSKYDHVHSIFRVPTDGAILMGAHTGAYKSTDNGKTFERMKIQSTDEYVNPDDKLMNFAYDAEKQVLFAGTHDSGLLKSTNFGRAWEKTDVGIDGRDIHGLAMNPLDAKLIYVYSVGFGLYGTDDGGKEWYKMDDGPKNPQVNNYTYMPTITMMDRNAKRENSTKIGYLFAATGGGLYQSFACFCGWSTSDAIPTSETIYTLAVDPQNRDAMLLARKDGLYRTTDAGENFELVSSDMKDIGALWFDIDSPETVIAATNYGIIYESRDSGLTWNKN